MSKPETNQSNEWGYAIPASCIERAFNQYGQEISGPVGPKVDAARRTIEAWAASDGEAGQFVTAQVVSNPGES